MAFFLFFYCPYKQQNKRQLLPGKSGQELKVGTEAETTENTVYWLVFLYHSGQWGPVLTVGWTLPGQSPGQMLTDRPTGQCAGGNLLI